MRRPSATGPPVIFAREKSDDSDQLRQEPSRRRPRHNNPAYGKLIMAQTNLALSGANASAHLPLIRPVLASHDSSNPVILALDLGTTTGYAIRTGDERIVSGAASFRPSRYDGGGIRYLRFRNWLEQVAAESVGLEAVYFEEVRRHVGTDAAHLYGGFLATLTSWCETKAIAYQGVPVGTIKRHVTGKGNSDKDAVIAAIRARGFNPADDNEADAIAILLWAIETAGGVR
jgi:hypothetical protein